MWSLGILVIKDVHVLAVIVLKSRSFIIFTYNCIFCISETPSFTGATLPPSQTILYNQTSFMLTCSVRGRPAPRVNWYKNSQPIGSGDTYNITATTRSVDTYSFIVVSRLLFQGMEACIELNWLLYRYFIALREIYQNVCPEVPGNLGTNCLVYFPRSNEITVMLHFTCENAWKIDPKF